MALNPDTGKEYTYEEFKHKFNGISGDAWNQSGERVEYDLDQARKAAAEAAAQQQAIYAQQQAAQQAAYDRQAQLLREQYERQKAAEAEARKNRRLQH